MNNRRRRHLAAPNSTHDLNWQIRVDKAYLVVLSAFPIICEIYDLLTSLHWNALKCSLAYFLF